MSLIFHIEFSRRYTSQSGPLVTFLYDEREQLPNPRQSVIETPGTRSYPRPNIVRLEPSGLPRVVRSARIALAAEPCGRRRALRLIDWRDDGGIGGWRIVDWLLGTTARQGGLGVGVG